MPPGSELRPGQKVVLQDGSIVRVVNLEGPEDNLMVRVQWPVGGTSAHYVDEVRTRAGALYHYAQVLKNLADDIGGEAGIELRDYIHSLATSVYQAGKVATAADHA